MSIPLQGAAMMASSSNFSPSLDETTKANEDTTRIGHAENSSNPPHESSGADSKSTIQLVTQPEGYEPGIQAPQHGRTDTLGSSIWFGSSDSHPSHEAPKSDKPGPHMSAYENGFIRLKNDVSRRWHQSNLLRVWWRESLCCVLAVGALIALMITVRTFEGKFVPHWQYGLSLNVLVAAYTVAMKGAGGLVLAEGISHLKWTNLAKLRPLDTFDIHDQASRGPWGAVQLLWREKYRNISSLGAFVTLLLFLLDPFSQQVLRFYECQQVFGDLAAAIPRTNSYAEEGKHLGPISRTIPQLLRSTLNNGLYAVRKPEVSFACPSGNCTFQTEYSTNGFCSSCQDATERLVQTEFNDSSINVTLPAARDGGPNLTLTRLPQGSSSNACLLSSFDSISDMKIIRWEEDPVQDSHTLSAFSCSMYPCVKSYTASVAAGHLNETLVDVSAASDFVPMSFELGIFNYYSIVDLHCIESPEQRQKLRDTANDINETVRWMSMGLSNMTFCSYPAKDGTSEEPLALCQAEDEDGISIGAKHAVDPIPAKCAYHFGKLAIDNQYDSLYFPTFTGQLNESWNYGYAADQGPEPLMALWYAGSGKGTLEDITGFMQNVTDALTIHVRQNGNPNYSDPVIGQVLYSTTCVRVQWVWLAYAGSTVFLLLVFFFGMIVQARIAQSQLLKQCSDGDKVPLTHDFKSSVLSLLFHGFDADSQRLMIGVGVANREDELEEKAKEVAVRLVSTDQGWKLSTVI